MSRRTLALPSTLVSAALVVLLAACGSTSDQADTTTDEPSTRTITDTQGSHDIPSAPERIVAVDENAALNLMSIGITPTVVFDSWNTTIPAQLIADAGVTVEHVGSATYYPDLETVAAQEPDLIVASDASSNGTPLPEYDQVAPTVHALYSAPWDEVVTAYGEYFDQADRAAAIVDALNEKTAAVADSQPATPVSLSVLMAYPANNLLLWMDDSNPVQSVVESAGFIRPEAESASVAPEESYGGWSQFSAENLGQHDADIMAVTSGQNYDPAGITGLPVFDSLQVAQNDAVATVDGDFWSGGYAFATYWVIDDLESFVAGDATAGAAADATDRWEAFLADIDG